MSNGYVGWKLPEAERARLLALIPPAYPNVVAHHITHKFGVDDTYPIPPMPTRCVITGVADNGDGVQCLIVEIGDTYDRPDGGRYHITWSLADGRKAVESNPVALAWPLIPGAPLQSIFFHSEPIVVVPQFFPHGS